MTQAEINNIQKKVTDYVDSGRLRDAFRLMRNTTEATMLWEIGDVVGRIEQNYAYMLRYLTDGADDPSRDTMYAAITDDILRVLDMLVRRLRTPEQPTLYFNTLRTLQLRNTSLEVLLEDWQRLHDATPSGLTRDIENKETELFRTLWTKMPLTAGESDAIVLRTLDPDTPQRMKVLMVTALTLGLLEYFDAARFDALIEIYMTGTTALTEEGADRLNAYELTGMALTGILLGLFRYRRRSLPQATVKRLRALDDVPRWRSDLRIAFLELIRTRYTERINRTMREEILPGMMKMKPDIIQNISKGTIDPENLEANPEWEELLRKSGIADKLRELSEIQMEGGDVLMSTFSHLKSFPFFTEVVNWFIPFEASRSDVVNTGLPPSLAQFVENLPLLCSSDKYSFFLSLSMVPKQQQDLMLSQFKMQSNQFMEEMAHALETGTPDEISRRTITGYLRNLYRFYNLFRRKGEFYNPFKEGVNLLDIPVLADAFDDAEMLRVVAELFFKFEYWSDAAIAFTRLDAIDEPDGAVFQKLGYCHHRLGDFGRALDYYHQAEIFNPDSRWLLGRMAAAYSSLGQHAQAADYYRRLSSVAPDDVSGALLLGNELLRQGLYADAVKEFYRAEYLDPEGRRAWRPLAWTLFLDGRPEDSLRYHERVMTDNPTATDYLNLGHLHLSQGRYKQAVEEYRHSLSLRHGDTEGLIADIKKDATALAAAGVDSKTTAMVTDALLYSLK